MGFQVTCTFKSSTLPRPHRAKHLLHFWNVSVEVDHRKAVLHLPIEVLSVEGIYDLRGKRI